MNEVHVRVPATSANLGPGFDCLGIALDLYNTVATRRSPVHKPNEMVDAAAALFFQKIKSAPFSFDWTISGDIPRSRGLGSSVAVRLGILHGLNQLADSPLDNDSIYQLCCELEGHPDNAAPGAFGGFTAALQNKAFFRCDVSSDLHFVLLIPEHEVETDASRLQLPENISHADAVKNSAHTARIAAAFASQQYHLLRDSMQDWLHQPWRGKVLTHLFPVISAGVAAGALDGYLSGSGSAVACVTLENPEKVASAMHSVLPDAKCLILHADNAGAAIIS